MKLVEGAFALRLDGSLSVHHRGDCCGWQRPHGTMWMSFAPPRQPNQAKAVYHVVMRAVSDRSTPIPLMIEIATRPKDGDLLPLFADMRASCRHIGGPRWPTIAQPLQVQQRHSQNSGNEHAELRACVIHGSVNRRGRATSSRERVWKRCVVGLKICAPSFGPSVFGTGTIRCRRFTMRSIGQHGKDVVRDRQRFKRS